jgi:hypothetical protein
MPGNRSHNTDRQKAIHDRSTVDIMPLGKSLYRVVCDKKVLTIFAPLKKEQGLALFQNRKYYGSNLF